MKPAQIAKTIAQSAFEPFETLKSQVGAPILEEAVKELGFGASLASRPRALAQEDLQRARNAEKLEKEGKEDNKTSQERARTLISSLQQEYRQQHIKEDKQQRQLKEEVVELTSEVVKLAKAAGVDTKAHLEQMPKKIGVLDIKRLTSMIKFLRVKAQESKSAKDLVQQRNNAKPATGMLAWVSGKQMKVHEQGTLQLQG